MYVLDRSAQMLLEAIRSTALPSLADDIESHLQAGKVPLFERKPDQFKELEEKRVSTLVAKDMRDSAPVEVNPTDEELSVPYTPEEQIYESLRLIRERLEATVEIAQDIERATDALGMAGVSLIYVTGESVELLTTPDRAAATLHDWEGISLRVRDWMEAERIRAERDAE